MKQISTGFPTSQFCGSPYKLKASRGLLSMDHFRARDDPGVVKKVPYYKANRIVLETEVLKLDLLPWPKNWCEEKRLSMMEWAIKECRTVQLVSEVIASKFKMEA
ncbi:hypothetical protein Peur_000288 [Populus x canadensis]